MKKIVCFLLICVLCALPLASCGEALPEKVIGDATIESKTVTLDEDYEVLQLTIAESEPGKNAIVYVDEQNEDDYFFAYDEDGACYRILYSASLFKEVVKEGKTIYLTYEKDNLKNLDSSENQHGFTPQYELDPRTIWSVKAWELKEIANEKASEAFGVSPDALHLNSCYAWENGTYEFMYRAYIADLSAGSPSLYLKENGEIERVDLGYKGEMLKYIGTDIEKAIPAAKQRILEKAGKLEALSLNEREDGYVYLTMETIEHLSPDDPRYGKVGCGDHDHVFYSEKLGKVIENE